MAVTKIKPIHRGQKRTYKTAITNTINYIINGNKTDEGKNITTYECDIKTIIQEWNLTRKLYKKLTRRENDKEVVAYHIIQSFRPGEVTEQLSNEIGNVLAMDFTKGKYQYIVATHNELNHIHNHIIVNAFSLNGKRKFRNFWNSSKALALLSDRICLEKGLSIIEVPANKSAKYNKWAKESNQKNHREKLKYTIDKVLDNKCENFEKLIEGLQIHGYDVRYGKHIAVKGMDQKQYIRLTSLGVGYTEIELREKLGKVNGAKTHISLLIDINKKLQEGKGKGYERWSKVFNIKQMAKTINYLREHDIDSYEDLEERVNIATMTYREINDEIKVIESEINNNNKLKKAIIDYMNTKKIFNTYKLSGYNQDYKATHEAELVAFQNARKTFNEFDLKRLPKIADLHKRNGILFENKKRLYQSYKERKDNYQELLKVKSNIDNLLNDKTQDSKIKEKSSL